MYIEVRGRCRKWTPKHIQELSAYWLAGDSLSDIAQRLGRSRGSCTAKLAQLRIRRPDPLIQKRKKAGFKSGATSSY